MSHWCYRFSRNLARVVSAPFVRLNVWRAPGAVEIQGGAVVVANHISHFDPVLLSCVFQRSIDWMTTEEFYAHPLGGRWLRALNTLPVDRTRPDRRVLRLGAERLRAGRLLGVFPEGGIRAGATSILGGAASRRGATVFARLANVPILPCIIFGSDRLYAVRSWRPLPPRTPVWVGIGKAISVSSEDENEANTCLADSLRELGKAVIEQFTLRPEDLPMTPKRRKGREKLP